MKLPPEQTVISLVTEEVTHDARRIVLAGLRNGDPEMVILAIQRAAELVGKDAAVRGGLQLIDQFMSGAFGEESIDSW